VKVRVGGSRRNQKSFHRGSRLLFERGAGLAARQRAGRGTPKGGKK